MMPTNIVYIAYSVTGLLGFTEDRYYSKEFPGASFYSHLPYAESQLPTLIPLYAERHNRVDNVVVVLLQRLDGLVARDVGLGADKLNVLVLQTRGVNLSLVLLLSLLVARGLGGLALAVVVLVVVLMVVAGVVVARVFRVSLRQLLGSRGLGLGVEVLDLGLAKDAGTCQSATHDDAGAYILHVGVAVGRLVHLRLVDDEQDLQIPLASCP